MTVDQNVRFVMPNELVPHPKHDFYHTPFQLDDSKYDYVKADILSHGIRTPLYVQTGTNIILDGHMRNSIATELSMRVPVLDFDVDEEAAESILIEENNKRQGEERDPMRIARQLNFMKEHYGLLSGTTVASLSDERRGKVLRDEDIAKRVGLGLRQQYLYIRLNDLIGPLQELITAKVIGVRGGSILAGLTQEQQDSFYQGIEGHAQVSESMIRAYKVQLDRTSSSEQSDRHTNLTANTNEETETSNDRGLRSDTNENAGALVYDLTSGDNTGYDELWRDKLAENPVDSFKRAAVRKMSQTFHNPEDAVGYQTTLFDMTLERQTNTIERFERDLFAILTAESIAVGGEQREPLVRFSNLLERFSRKIATVLETL